MGVSPEVFFSPKNNPKNLDPSYKMDLDLWDCLERVKLVLYQYCIGVIQLFVLIVERGKLYLIAELIRYPTTCKKTGQLVQVLSTEFMMSHIQVSGF